MEDSVIDKYRDVFKSQGLYLGFRSDSVNKYNEISTTQNLRPELLGEILYCTDSLENKILKLNKAYLVIRERLEIIKREFSKAAFHGSYYARDVFELMCFYYRLKEDVETDFKIWNDSAESITEHLSPYFNPEELRKIYDVCGKINECICKTIDMLQPVLVQTEDVVKAFRQILYMDEAEVYQEQRCMYTYIEKWLRDSNLKEKFDREDWDRMMKVNIDFLDLIGKGKLEEASSPRYEYDGRIDSYKGNNLQQAIEYITLTFPKFEPIALTPWVMLHHTIPSSDEWSGFFMIMHRYMAIQCGMFPQLISQYIDMKYSRQKENKDTESIPTSKSKENYQPAKKNNKKPGNKAHPLEDFINGEDKQSVITEIEKNLKNAVTGPAAAKYVDSLIQKGTLNDWPTHSALREHGLKVGSTAWSNARKTV